MVEVKIVLVCDVVAEGTIVNYDVLGHIPALSERIQLHCDSSIILPTRCLLNRLRSGIIFLSEPSPHLLRRPRWIMLLSHNWQFVTREGAAEEWGNGKLVKVAVAVAGGRATQLLVFLLIRDLGVCHCKGPFLRSLMVPRYLPIIGILFKSFQFESDVFQRSYYSLRCFNVLVVFELPLEYYFAIMLLLLYFLAHATDADLDN